MSILNRLFFRSRDKPTDFLPGGSFSFLFGGSFSGKAVNERKSTEKIDGAVAMVMGFARASVGGGIQMSIYDQRGLISF